MAQLVASMSGVVLGGVVEVVGSNLARGKIFTASIGSVDSLYPSVYIYILTVYIYIQSKLFITSLVITDYSISDIKLFGTDLFPIKFPLYNRIFT